MDKQRRKTTIPSANPWKYLLNYQHVPETAKLQKEEVVQLQCRTTHCVRLQQQDYNENEWAVCHLWPQSRTESRVYEGVVTLFHNGGL